MADKMEIVERTEPITIEEVFDFIDDTSIGKMDAHELKSRIVDMEHEVREKAIDEFAERLKVGLNASYCDIFVIDEIAEQLKAGGNHE
jgi:hypothetical protein